MIQFDPSTQAKFNPPNLHFDEDISKAIMIFDDEVWEDYICGDNSLQTFPVKNKHGRVFDYFKIMENSGEKILLIAPAGGSGGAAMSASDMEMLIASGIEKIVAFGTCGSMMKNVARNSFVIPTFAVREEGVSYHYLPPSDEVEQDKKSVAIMRRILAETYYIEGKVWTTDAVYRETIGKIETMQNAGCVAVDMELASLLAVAKFRKIKFAEFLIIDDNIIVETDKFLPRSSQQILGCLLQVLQKL